MVVVWSVRASCVGYLPNTPFALCSGSLARLRHRLRPLGRLLLRLERAFISSANNIINMGVYSAVTRGSSESLLCSIGLLKIDFSSRNDLRSE